MNRREFCKTVFLAAGFLSLGRLRSVASVLSDKPAARGTKYSVKVLRRLCFDDLQGVYLMNPECGRCERFDVEREYSLRVGAESPAGFCPLAWKAIQNRIAEQPCASQSSKMSSIVVSCPDGTRPVLFAVTPE